MGLDMGLGLGLGEDLPRPLLSCRFTIQWRAGNVACKVLMVVRALGYYLSSAILVSICIDR